MMSALRIAGYEGYKLILNRQKGTTMMRLFCAGAISAACRSAHRRIVFPAFPDNFAATEIDMLSRTSNGP